MTVLLALKDLGDLTVSEDLFDSVTEAVKPRTSCAESLPVASRLPPFWLEWRCHSCQTLLGCRDLQATLISAFLGQPGVMLGPSLNAKRCSLFFSFLSVLS